MGCLTSEPLTGITQLPPPPPHRYYAASSLTPRPTGITQHPLSPPPRYYESSSPTVKGCGGQQLPCRLFERPSMGVNPWRAQRAKGQIAGWVPRDSGYQNAGGDIWVLHADIWVPRILGGIVPSSHHGLYVGREGGMAHAPQNIRLRVRGDPTITYSAHSSRPAPSRPPTPPARSRAPPPSRSSAAAPPRARTARASRLPRRSPTWLLNAQKSTFRR